MNDRTGQVWRPDRSIYLVVDVPFKAPRVREVMGTDVWYHPCVAIDEGIHTVLGETIGHPWEDVSVDRDRRGYFVRVVRERIT